MAHRGLGPPMGPWVYNSFHVTNKCANFIANTSSLFSHPILLHYILYLLYHDKTNTAKQRHTRVLFFSK